MVLETSYASRNIGDIFYTLRKDATLNGAVPCTGSEFDISDFGSSDDIASLAYLIVNSLVSVVSYAEYDLQIKNNGCCASFGYDDVNGKFKVPTIKDVYVRAGDSATLAKYLAPGLPNITGRLRLDGTEQYGSHVVSGVFANVGNTGGRYGRGHDGGSNPEIDFNAARSSSIYGRSSTVQPPSIVLRPMIQLITVMGSSEDEESGEDAPVEYKLPYIFVPGTEAKATEVNANFDYILKLLTTASISDTVVHIAGKETITGQKIFTAPTTMSAIEMFPTTGGAYIDFHYDGEQEDYTARLFESVRGYLAVNQNPPASDSSTKIATTNWVNSKITSSSITGSLATNGWTKLPNGLIIQWGRFATSGYRYGNSFTVNFPTAFPTACLSVAQNTDIRQGIGNKGDSIGMWFSRTQLGVYVGTESWKPTVYWIAVGY